MTLRRLIPRHRSSSIFSPINNYAVSSTATLHNTTTTTTYTTTAPQTFTRNIFNPFFSLEKFGPSPTSVCRTVQSLNKLVPATVINSETEMEVVEDHGDNNFFSFHDRFATAIENVVHHKRSINYEALGLNKVIMAVIDSGDLDAASNIARDAVARDAVTISNIVPTWLTCYNLLRSMFLAGRYEDGVTLFDFFDNNKTIRNDYVTIAIYNLLIKAHCDAGHVDKALQLYNYVLGPSPSPDITPDDDTYTLLTKGLVSANRLSEAVDLLHQMRARDSNINNFALVYANLISGYLESDDLERANELFHEFIDNPGDRHCVKDGYVYASFMEYYLDHNMEKEAMELYKSLLNRQLVMLSAVYNELLNVLLKHGKFVEANTLFDSIFKQDTPFHTSNSHTFNIMVNHWFGVGKVSEALSVFNIYRDEPAPMYGKLGPLYRDVVVHNNIIGKLFDTGMVAEAGELVDEVCSKLYFADVTTYTILFDAYFKQERIRDVLKWFRHLVLKTTFEPSFALVNSVFSRLINKGMIEEAGEILERMTQGGRQKPFLVATSYELVLTESCKQGKLDLVQHLLGVMLLFNIGATPKLHGIVRDAFGKEDRVDQIESKLWQLTEPRYIWDFPRCAGHAHQVFENQ